MDIEALFGTGLKKLETLLVATLKALSPMRLALMLKF